MEKETENKGSYTVQEMEQNGAVHIADEVIAVIAGLAATEVDGVACMTGNLTNEMLGKLGSKALSKGVRVNVKDKKVTVNLSLSVHMGYSIPDITTQVQDRVKTAIENMTAMEVLAVNVHIADVSLN